MALAAVSPVATSGLGVILRLRASEFCNSACSLVQLLPATLYFLRSSLRPLVEIAMSDELPTKVLLPGDPPPRLLAGESSESLPIPAKDVPSAGELLSPRRVPKLLALLLVLGLFGWADLLVVPGMCTWDQDDWGAVFVYVMLGLITAQFAVVAAWLAWGEPEFWRRLLIVGGLALVYVPTWMLGCAAGNWIDNRGFRLPDDEAKFIYATALLLPPVMLALALPLHVMRALFGWRLSRSGLEADAGRPLAIGDLLVAMAVVAAALTSARLAKQLAGGTNESEFWLELGTGAACGGAASFMLVLPLTWLSFRLRSVPTVVAAIGLFSILAAGVLWMTAALVFRAPLPRLWEMIGLVITGAIGMYAVGAILLLARGAGYRLQTRRSAA